jgi:hypothetical protein
VLRQNKLQLSFLLLDDRKLVWRPASVEAERRAPASGSWRLAGEILSIEDDDIAENALGQDPAFVFRDSSRL